MTTQQMISAGRDSFLNRCAGCHGPEADGKGPAAPMLNPKPRNLLSGSFKFRSTPPGVLPTIEDLLRTIDRGIPGSAMPPFRDVGEEEKLSLVLYIRSLRPEFEQTKADQVSVTVPPPPKEIFSAKAELIRAAGRGRKSYETSCLTCHGAEGRGDGPSVEGMTDAEDMPIRPADLTKQALKSGPTASDVYRAITLGIEGAPMPSYGPNFTEKQRWDLVAYVFYLRGKGAGIYGAEDKLP